MSTTIRAGDTVRYLTTGEELVVAYASGDSLSVHAVEPDEVFLARWQKNIDDNWPDDAPVLKPKRPDARLHVAGVPLGVAWPKRRWAVEVPHPELAELPAPSVEGEGELVATLDYFPLGTEPAAAVEVEEREADEEVSVSAADVALVRACTDEEHERVLAYYAGLPTERAPCSACATRLRDKHPPHQVIDRIQCPTCVGTGIDRTRPNDGPKVCALCLGCGMVMTLSEPPCPVCGGTGLEVLDRRPTACAAQLGTITAAREAAAALESAQPRELPPLLEDTTTVTDEG